MKKIIAEIKNINNQLAYIDHLYNTGQFKEGRYASDMILSLKKLKKSYEKELKSS